MKKAAILSCITLVIFLCGCVGEQDGKIDVPYTSAVTASDLSITGLKAELSGTNILFTLHYTSGKNRFFSFFNPPDGSIIKHVEENGLKPGTGIISFEIDAEKLSKVSNITMIFGIYGDSHDDNAIFLKPGMRYAGLLEKAKSNPKINESMAQVENPAKVENVAETASPDKINIDFDNWITSPELSVTKLQAEASGTDILFTLYFTFGTECSFSFFNPPAGSIIMYFERNGLEPGMVSKSFRIDAAKLSIVDEMTLLFFGGKKNDDGLYFKLDKNLKALAVKAKNNPVSGQHSENAAVAENPNIVDIGFESHIKASDLSITKLQAENSGADILFTLNYTSGKGRFLAFFNPPNGSIIMYYQQNGLKQGTGNVSFKIDAAKLSSVSAITMRFSTRDEDAEDANFIYLSFDKKYKSLLENAKPLPETQNDEEIASDSDYKTNLNPAGQLGIVRHPDAADYSFIHGDKLTVLPAYEENSGQMWQVDIRSTDISSLDLTGRSGDLMHANFDSKTMWPSILPKGFDPARIMELGKNPGLHVRDLHKKGITGKGIGIAIIDQGLLVDHIEYKDRIKLYEELHSADDHSAMHGPAVASIAVGKTVGVAPEADLYYIAETHGVFKGEGKFDWDLTWLAKSIDRIVEINKSLPAENRIRVISISLGVGTQLNNGNKALESIARARENGIYTAYVGSNPYSGMGRNPMSDSDDFRNFIPGSFLATAFFSGRISNEEIWIPMDSRCTASPTGTEDYVYYSEGGMSWTVPYVAGLYALACQVMPDVTPELFWQIANTTGKTIDLEKDGKVYKFGKIIDPVKLINVLKAF